MKSIRIVRIILWVALIAWMLFIFHLSDQPATLSAETSRTISQQILEVVQEDPTPQMIYSFDRFLRNSAHFGVFFVLGLLAYPTFFVQGWKYPAMIALLFTVSYAFSDEFHQIFVDGRAFQGKDLLLDSIGGFLGILLAFFVCYLLRKQSRKRN